MPILALDTTTLVSGAALLEQDTLLAEITLQTKLTHSERLMPHIAQLLAMAQVEPQALDGVAVSIGPGSFTGLRIGLATAKSMAYALSIPIVGVPTLMALAGNCPLPGCYLAPLLDAQRGNVYTALYQWRDGRLEETAPCRVAPLDDVLAELGRLDAPAVALGEAAAASRARIDALGGRVIAAPPHLIMARAASVGVLGQTLLAAGAAADVMTLEPLYIRRSEAEVLWEKRRGKTPC